MTTTGVEAIDAIAWANTLLTSDSTFTAAAPGGVHIGLAPDATPTPFCTLWVQSAPEYLTAFGQHIWTDATLMAKFSGPPDAAMSVRTSAARAHTLLHRATGGAQGSVIISCVMTQAFPLPEPTLVNGVQWISIIQLYRVQIQ